MYFYQYKIDELFYYSFLQEMVFVGQYRMPILKAVHGIEPENLLPFNYVRREQESSNKWFHFYVHDYQFERIWNNPDKYMPILQKFAGGISPDFSIYLDMYEDQQIENCRKNKILTYYFQLKGLNVIPNVGWSDSNSLNWAFDGIPENSVLSITTQGCMRNYISKQSLLNGLHELDRRKRPEKLIVYGRFPEKWKDKFSMPILVYPSFCAEKWGNTNG